MNKVLREISIAIICFLVGGTSLAQDLDPRAYARIPVNGTLLILGSAYSEGGVVTDPTLPLTDLEATVETASVGGARTFSLFGQTSQALVVIPYGWVNASALIDEETKRVKRAGFADMRVRCSMLLLGGKATPISEFSKVKSHTVLGTSLTVIVPTGQYFSDKLINLGTSRWSFKPEVGLSQLIGKRWMLDFYAGVWFFTNNKSFYPGSSIRTQDPLVAFQTHLSYNLSPRMWAAVNATFYAGGQSSVNDIYKDDRVENSRIGGTLVFPVGKRNALKIAYSTGAVVRVGSDFSTVTLGWSTAWFEQSKKN